ncbi:unnamed protein product [Nezara viridula]|uniref:Uncharacterized protein n=1 Tax=Nezara viridula TaxID=85310 RepID=A0A9P0MPJ7_NEZVI|nr:unnamed protein product [Nezara viridula]
MRSVEMMCKARKWRLIFENTPRYFMDLDCLLISETIIIEFLFLFRTFRSLQ